MFKKIDYDQQRLHRAPSVAVASVDSVGAGFLIPIRFNDMGRCLCHWKIRVWRLTLRRRCSYFVLMASSDISNSQRRFPPPWKVTAPDAASMIVTDANDVPVAWIFHRDETQRFGFGSSKLSTEEARRIANAIARIPEFMTQRRGFHPRRNWRVDRPYHVALDDTYIRERWSEIDALCKLNSLPFNATGEKIQADGLWRVYEFANQMDGILFWAAFNGRWLRGNEFHYPERPADLPRLQPLQNWPTFDPKKARS